MFSQRHQTGKHAHKKRKGLALLSLLSARWILSLNSGKSRQYGLWEGPCRSDGDREDSVAVFQTGTKVWETVAALVSACGRNPICHFRGHHTIGQALERTGMLDHFRILSQLGEDDRNNHDVKIEKERLSHRGSARG